jgi:iron complex transport system substrate-binding protein
VIRAFLLVAALCLSACRGAAPPAEGPAQRIVSLAPSVTEVLFALGAGDRVVGVTRYCDHPPEAKKLPKIGGFADPNLEAILALRPDLVVAADNPVSQPVLARLGALGVKTLAVKPDDLAGVESTVRAVAAALGRGEEAERLVGGLRASLDQAAARVPPGPRPRVLFVYGHRPLVVAGPGSFADDMLRRAGAENVAGDARVPYPKLAIEDVLRLRPEVILDASMGEGEGDVLGFWARWPELPAVAASRVVRAEQPGLMQPGLRVGDGLAWLVRTLHP